MMNKLFISKTILIVIFLFSSHPLLAQDSIVLSTHLTKGRYDYKVTFIIMEEAFKRNDLKLELQPMPGSRSLQQAEDGKTDGDAHRIFDLIKNKGLHNLIRIPEIQQVIHDYAWSKKNLNLDNGWSDLSAYTVGVHLGTVFVPAQAKKHAKFVWPVNNTEQMFKMLITDRLDLVIATPSNADILKTEAFKNSVIRRIEPPLTSLDIYTYLHKKHRDLVPRVAESLHTMKVDGTYRKLIQSIQ